MTRRLDDMKNTGIILVLASLALGLSACGEALDEPVESESRQQQSLNMENADIEPVQPTVEVCRDCVDVEVFVLHQTAETQSDDDDSDDDSDSTAKLQQNKQDPSGDSTVMDGNPVPFPLEPQDN